MTTVVYTAAAAGCPQYGCLPVGLTRFTEMRHEYQLSRRNHKPSSIKHLYYFTLMSRTNLTFSSWTKISHLIQTRLRIHYTTILISSICFLPLFINQLGYPIIYPHHKRTWLKRRVYLLNKSVITLPELALAKLHHREPILRFLITR